MALDSVIPERLNWLALNGDYNRVVDEGGQAVETDSIYHLMKSLVGKDTVTEKENRHLDCWERK